MSLTFRRIRLRDSTFQFGILCLWTLLPRSICYTESLSAPFNPYGYPVTSQPINYTLHCYQYSISAQGPLSTTGEYKNMQWVNEFGVNIEWLFFVNSVLNKIEFRLLAYTQQGALHAVHSIVIIIIYYSVLACSCPCLPWCTWLTA